jgi:small subunit ribosomal protein S6
MVSNSQPVPEAPEETTVSETVKETPKETVVAGAGLNNYELVVIIASDVAEEKLEARLSSISQYITTHGGTVASLDKWGKRRMAYPIKKAVEGNYVLFKFMLPPGASRELENNLRISENVLRYLIVRVGE